MKIKNILWATDGSGESLKALKIAKTIAKKYNASIKGYYVIKDINKKIFDILNMDLNLNNISKKEKERAKEFFNTIDSNLKKDELKFSYSLGFGIPEKEIVSYAESKNIDLIVLGKRGLGLFETNLTGSVTNKVVQSSSVPVLVYNSKSKKRITNINKILVPINLSEDILSSFEYAVFLAKKFKSKITLVYVEEYYTYPLEMPIGVMDDLRDYFSKKLDNLVSKYQTRDMKIDTKVIESVSTYLGILRLCESLKPDLIIMNTHGKMGIKKFVLGSVAEKIISDMPCPVLTLKP